MGFRRGRPAQSNPDEEPARDRAEVMRHVVLGLIPMTWLWALVFGLSTGAVLRGLVLGAAFSAVALWAWLLARRGNVRLGSICLVIAGCVIVGLTALTGGGARASSYASFATMISLAGVLLGVRAIIAVTLVALGYGFVLVWLGAEGRLPPSQVPMTALAGWLGTSATFVTVAVLQELAVRNASRGAKHVQAYRSVFDAAAVGLLEMDFSRVRSLPESWSALDRVFIRHANGEALRILDVHDASEALGPCSRTMAELTPLDDMVLSTRDVSQRAFLLRTRTGQVRTLLLTLRWQGQAKDRSKLVLSGLDITEQRAMEERLRQLERLEALGRLAGGVAHDFNNLLTVIGGHAALLRKRWSQDTEGLRDLQAIEDTTARAASLTHQLLTFSRQEVHHPKVVAVDALLERFQGLLSRLIGEHIEFELELGAPGATARIDPAHLEQIVMNLVLNARDAMPRGGRLRVETRIDQARLGTETRVNLRVSDTGAGMDEVTQGRIFEPFFTTKDAGRGTGLGLATVHGIVQRAGGRIGVRSGPGQGTRFDVWLPCADAAEPEAIASTLRSTLRPRRATLLVVEDQEPVRDVVCALLEDAGYLVHPASGAEEALRLAQAGLPIDAVLTDVVMPGVGGRELAERLVALRGDVPIIYMSGHTGDVVLRHGVEQDAAWYVQKPFSEHALIEAVELALSGVPRVPELKQVADSARK